MKKRPYIVHILLGLACALSLALPAWAQTGGVQGQVFVRLPDGSKKPAANVLVEFYRLDVKGYYKVKTNKSGRFAHIGLPYGRYAIVLSGEGLNPYYEYNVRIPPGPPIEKTFELIPGSGQRLTLEQIKQYQAQGAQAQTLSPEERQKQLEEALKKQEEQRKKAERDKEMIKHFEAGKQLASAEQYDEAINEYKLALEASPDHPQLYVIMGKMAEAYFNQGVKRNNSGQRQLATQSFALAAETAKKAIDMIPAEKANEKPPYIKLYAQAMAVSARFDNSKLDQAIAAYRQLMEAQTSPEEKRQTKLEIAKLYNDTGRSEEAIATYKEILQEDPKNADALFGLGLALAASPDPNSYPEAIKTLERFVKQVSKDQSKADKVAEAKSVIAALKEYIKQQK
ncbi:MAG: tetratricopeptide repeat protein [Acidobacteria bacterium]|nr:MAG: tetratricopeptide repeat protein [Acidobacteriota bacterium]